MDDGLIMLCYEFLIALFAEMYEALSMTQQSQFYSLPNTFSELCNPAPGGFFARDFSPSPQREVTQEGLAQEL